MYISGILNPIFKEFAHVSQETSTVSDHHPGMF